MRDDHYWPDWDSDHVRQAPAQIFAEEGLAGELLDAGEQSRTPPSRGKRFLGKVLMATGGVLVLGVVLYAIDLSMSAGDVPRGVVVAGVDVGGLSQAEAEAKLRRELEPRLTTPVPILAGDVQATLDPVRSGLGLDWPSTLEQAGNQPLDPITRIKSFFTSRDVGVVTKTDADALSQAVAQLATDRLNHSPTEGGIGFQSIPGSDDGVTAYAIEPRAGQTLNDVRGAAGLVKAGWLDKNGVRLPVDLTPVKATSAGVHAALDELVTPAVSKPVAVRGAGADALLKPAAIAAAMRFVPRADGALEVQVDPAKLQQNLQPQLGTTEKTARDAQIVFTDGGPTVQPSEDARRINWADTFKPLMAVFTKADGRELPVRYQTSRPQVTTEAAGALGIREVVSEFSTSGLSGGAAANVRAMADKVNGAIVRPGETFSLDARTGPRDRAQGFVPAPVNEDGTGRVVVGGGVSQFTTTLYNAAYFAGLTDAGHTEHSYYLDRYPAGRDAKSLQDNGSSVDLKFVDSLASGVAIQAISSGQTVTVRIWGVKQYRVESGTGSPADVTEPPSELGPPDGCQPSAGQPGFTITDIRVLYDLASGAEVRRDVRTARYEPKPTIICG